MRNATVRDLCNHHTSLPSWVSAGEEIIGASHVLTFDANQRKLAEHKGLVVPI